MDAYLTFWSSANFQRSEKEINETFTLAEVNFEILKENYSNIYLITDSKGQNNFAHIPYTKVYTILDVVPSIYKDTWCLGKLYSLRHIASLGKPFFHIDFDFFLAKKLPEKFTNAEVFLQSIEYPPLFFNYNIEDFKRYCIKKYLAENPVDIAFNGGIVGGNNLNFFYNYADTAIQMIQDPENEELWLKNYDHFRSYTKAGLAEQYYMACALKKYNITPELLFYPNYSPNHIQALEVLKELGAWHLYGHHKRFFIDRFHEIKNFLDLTLNKS